MTRVLLHRRPAWCGRSSEVRRIAGLAWQVDFEAVDAWMSFIASIGMRMRVSAARPLSRKGRQLVVFAAPELVQVALQHAGIDQIVPCRATEAGALATVQR